MSMQASTASEPPSTNADQRRSGVSAGERDHASAAIAIAPPRSNTSGATR